MWLSCDCVLLSDGLCTHLNIPKHPDFSRALLMKKQLQESYRDGQLKVASRE